MQTNEVDPNNMLGHDKRMTDTTGVITDTTGVMIDMNSVFISRVNGKTNTRCCHYSERDHRPITFNLHESRVMIIG